MTAKMRRAKQVRIEKILLTLIALIVTVILVLIVTLFETPKSITSAADTENYVSTKMYTSYSVKQGDTLTSIYYSFPEDKSVNEFIKEVKRTNHLETDEIIAGQSLIVPYIAIVLK